MRDPTLFLRKDYEELVKNELDWKIHPENPGTCGACGIEFGRDVRQEQDLLRRQAQFRLDDAVGVRFALGADARVEVAAEQRGQVAGPGVAEQQFLRVHRAGGIHVQQDARGMPGAQAVDRVRVDVAVEVAVAIAGLPDQALQCLQRSDLAVLIDPLDQLRDDAIEVQRLEKLRQDPFHRAFLEGHEQRSRLRIALAAVGEELVALVFIQDRDVGFRVAGFQD